jgi:anti-anti-sigma factor
MAENRLVATTVGQAAAVALDDSFLVGPVAIEQLTKDFGDLMDGQAHRHLVVDLSKVTYMSSAALTAMLSIRKKAEETGGAIALTGITPNLEKLFKVTSLHKLFVFADTVEDGVRKLERGETAP